MSLNYDYIALAFFLGFVVGVVFSLFIMVMVILKDVRSLSRAESLFGKGATVTLKDVENAKTL